MFLCSIARWEIFEQQIISEIISSLNLESEAECFAVRVFMKIGQMILTLEEIRYKKDIYFIKIKSDCAGVLKWIYLLAIFAKHMDRN